MKLPRILRVTPDEFIADLNKLRAAMESADTEEHRESECSLCGRPVVLLGGIWTAEDGETCYADPSPGFTPHKPKEN